MDIKNEDKDEAEKRFMAWGAEQERMEACMETIKMEKVAARALAQAIKLDAEATERDGMSEDLEDVVKAWEKVAKIKREVRERVIFIQYRFARR